MSYKLRKIPMTHSETVCHLSRDERMAFVITSILIIQSLSVNSAMRGGATRYDIFSVFLIVVSLLGLKECERFDLQSYINLFLKTLIMISSFLNHSCITNGTLETDGR